MLTHTLNRLKKVAKSIQTEGLPGYLHRLYDRGEYRRIWRKVRKAHLLQDLEVKLSNYRLALPKRNAGIKEELILYGTHEPFSTNLYQHYLKPGDLIFDVGTNLGYYIMVADQTLKGQCEVHGFEPDPEIFQLAQINSNQFRARVILNPYAVTDNNGMVSFYSSMIPNWGTIVPRDCLMLMDAVTVKGIRLDQYAGNLDLSPTVLRMDIEGGELFALRGSVGILPSLRFIFMELHCLFLEPHELEELFAILSAAGFDRAAWINRYYDWPWSNQKAQARSLLYGDLTKLACFAYRREYTTLSAFIFKKCHTMR